MSVDVSLPPSDLAHSQLGFPVMAPSSPVAASRDSFSNSAEKPKESDLRKRSASDSIDNATKRVKQTPSASPVPSQSRDFDASFESATDKTSIKVWLYNLTISTSSRWRLFTANCDSSCPERQWWQIWLHSTNSSQA